MCLEDLRLGKGRVALTTVNVTVSTNAALPADPRRVAILISFLGMSVGDPSAPSLINDIGWLNWGDVIATPFFINAAGTIQPFMLRVEDYGLAITQPVSVQITNGSGFARMALTPIITNVDAPPVFSGKP